MAVDGDWENGPAPEYPRNGRTPSPRRDRSRSPARAGTADGGGSRGPDGGVNPGNNLHVSGLSQRVTDADLEEAFAKFGKVAKAQAMIDPQTREPRGFGFVTMEQAEDANAAVEALNSTEFLGKVITVAKARRGRARTPTPGMYQGPPKRDNRGYGSGNEDRRGGGGGYDRGGYRDDYRRDDRRDYYSRDDRYHRDRYDDRRYDDRRYDDRRERGYDRREADRGYSRDDRRY